MKVMRAGLLVLLLVCTLLPAAAHAQVPVRPPVRNPVTRADSIRSRADTLRPRPDSLAARDTAAKANFANPDSVMQRLMNMPGYSITRYQGESIIFDAMSRGNLHFVSSRVENNSAFAADGYSRATGEVGVALVTSGPGVTNGVSAVTSAWFNGAHWTEGERLGGAVRCGARRRPAHHDGVPRAGDARRDQAVGRVGLDVVELERRLAGGADAERIRPCDFRPAAPCPQRGTDPPEPVRPQLSQVDVAQARQTGRRFTVRSFLARL